MPDFNDAGSAGRAAPDAGISRAGSTLRTAKAALSSRIDDDQRSLSSDSRTINRAASPLEFPVLLPAPKDQAKKKNNIYFDRRDVSIGKARYTDATHYSKNIAVKPNYIVGGGDLMTHSNVEVELYNKNGKALALTERYFRDWTFYPTDPKTTIRTFKGWDGHALPGSNEGLSRVPAAANPFFWDTSVRGDPTDAPGQQNLYKDTKTCFYLQEFIAGNDQAGGFYYQIEYMLDPDGTTQIRARNKLELTIEDFKFAKMFIKQPNFSKEYKDSLLISDLPGTINSDTGLETTIPDMVRKKKEAESKRKK